MKAKTVFYEFLFLLINALLLYPIGFMLQAAVFGGAPGWTGFTLVFLLLISYAAARFTRTDKNLRVSVILICLCALLSFGLAWFITGASGGASVFVAICTAGASVAYFFITRRFPSQFGLGRFIAGASFYIILGIVSRPSDPGGFYTVYSNAAGLIFILLALFGINSGSIRHGLYKGQDTEEGKLKLPAGVRRGNLILLSGFTVVSMAAAWIDQFKAFFGWIFSAIWFVIVEIFYFINGLFSPDPGGKILQHDDVTFLPGKTQGNTWLDTVIYIFSIIMLIAIALFVLFIIVWGIRKLIQIIIKAIPGIMEMLMGEAKRAEMEGYEDDTEELFDWELVKKQQTARFRRIFGRFKRPERFDDQKTNRDKVRFAFKLFLKRTAAFKKGIASLTPNELARDRYPLLPLDGDETAALVGIYNPARYSDMEVPDSAAAEARRFYEKLGGK